MVQLGLAWEEKMRKMEKFQKLARFEFFSRLEHQEETI